MALGAAFVEWMQQEVMVVNDLYLINAPIDSNGKTHRAALVRFSQRARVTIDVAVLTCEENSKIKVMQCLIESLKLEGTIVFLDAPHA